MLSMEYANPNGLSNMEYTDISRIEVKTTHRRNMKSSDYYRLQIPQRVVDKLGHIDKNDLVMWCMADRDQIDMYGVRADEVGIKFALILVKL